MKEPRQLVVYLNASKTAYQVLTLPDKLGCSIESLAEHIGSGRYYGHKVM